MIKVILRGFHGSIPPTLKLHHNQNHFYFKFKFHSNCWYPIDKSNINELDCNKLTGVGWGMYKEAHHKNSIRIGWLPAEEKGMIKLFAYTYSNGKRKITDLHTTVACGMWFEMEIILKEHSDHIEAICYFARTKHVVDFGWLAPRGYYLGFYHGGDLRAKQCMSSNVVIR